MNSSRQRAPSGGGKTNLSSRGAMALNSEAPNSQRSLDTTVKARLNNPIDVFRPFPPEGRVMNSHILRPPVLPKSLEPTIPMPLSSRPRGRSKLSCPEEFRQKLQAPNFFETADFKTLLDDSQKERFCRDFIDRNKNRLWKFDLKYLGMTPRSVCDDIVENREFIGIMRSYYIKERSWPC